ncbi:MAG: sugar-binding transcriptional regulator [Aerococcus sp.]|nr:sugar-binding transcriptional regulator [Aerococcus sp.]
MKQTESEMIKVASMYYEEGLTQAAIARQRGVSRSLIAKYLKEARELGIVEVVIKSESIYTARLERELEQRYHLKNAIVVDTQDLHPSEIGKRVSQRAALYLQDIIADYTRIGISWGNSLRRMVDSFPYMNHSEAELVPLIGGLSDDYFDIQSNQLTYELARKMRAKAKYLYAPALVSNALIRRELASNRAIQSVLAEGSQVELALVGISSLDQETNMRNIGYVDNAQYAALKAQGAVGVINSRFYDQFGQELANEINQSVLGITLNDLRKIPQVMTVVQGNQKVHAIEVALRTGMINTIVTTNTVAETIIDLSEANANSL